jgi:hypothetical protein
MFLKWVIQQYLFVAMHTNGHIDWATKRQDPHTRLCTNGEEFWDKKCDEAVQEGLGIFKRITEERRSKKRERKAKKSKVTTAVVESEEDLGQSDSEQASEFEPSPIPTPGAESKGKGVKREEMDLADWQTMGEASETEDEFLEDDNSGEDESMSLDSPLVSVGPASLSIPPVNRSLASASATEEDLTRKRVMSPVDLGEGKKRSRPNTPPPSTQR